MEKGRPLYLQLSMLIALTLAFVSGAFLICTTNTYAAEKLITKEYTFETDNTDFSYNAEKTIKVDGKQYKLKGIEYKIMSQENMYIAKDYVYSNLRSRSVPLKKTFKVNGEKLLLQADENDIRYSETIATTTETLSGRTLKPNLPKNKMVTVQGYTYDATLLGVTSQLNTIPFTATVKFDGDKGATYYLGNKKLILQDGGPCWSGYTDDVIKYLNLETGSTVSAGKWTSDYVQENGRTVRYAQFTGTRPATDYIATYSYKIYSAIVTYDNGLDPGAMQYTVKAICSYEKAGMSFLQKMICTGIGLCVLAILAAVILMILRRKNRKEIE